MFEEKPLRKFTLLLLTIAPLAYSGWDDTYICKTTKIWEVASNGDNSREKKQEIFGFSLNEKKQTLVFGEEAPFGDASLKVTYTIFARDGQESFDLKGNYSSAAYHNGIFTYSYASTWGARVVTADCQKM